LSAGTLTVNPSNSNNSNIPSELVAKWYMGQNLADDQGLATHEITADGKLLQVGQDNGITLSVTGNVITFYDQNNQQAGTVKYSVSGTVLSLSEATGLDLLVSSRSWYKKASTNQTPVDFDYDISNLTQTAGSVTAVTVTAKEGKSSGERTIYYEGIGPTSYAKSTTVPQTAGSYTVTFDVAAADGWNAATGLFAGTLRVKLLGETVSAPSSAAISYNSITLNALSTSTGQTIEYAYNGYNFAPSTGWQDGTIFSGLSATTTYYFFARSKENDVYNTGAVSEGTAIATTKYNGATVSAPSAAAISYNSITLNTITTNTGQSVEYARNDTLTAPSTGWQDSRSFTDLSAGTSY